MGFLQAAVKFRELAQLIDDTREEESIIIANDLAALMRNRVQNDKVDETGASYGQYSQAVVPKYYYYGKSLNQAGEEQVNNGDYFLSYETFREYNGQPTDAKNYTFSGEMWRDTGVVLVENSNTRTDVVIGGQTSRAAELLEYNSTRDNINLLAPSEQEINFVTEAHTERIINAINEVFN